MHDAALGSLAAFVHHWGLVAVFAVIALESMGVPMPGEATLISASLVAGTTHDLSITAVIATAAAAAMAGDNVGYMVGRRYGPTLLVRYGPRFGFDARRVKLGRYLFQRHGGLVVFFGRFVALLRAFAAVLAGTNLYAWSHFLAFNAAGAVIWATIYGLGAYFFGDAIHRVAGPIAIVLIAAVLVCAAVLWHVFKRQESRWLAAAETAFPGPVF